MSHWAKFARPSSVERKANEAGHFKQQPYRLRALKCVCFYHCAVFSLCVVVWLRADLIQSSSILHRVARVSLINAQTLTVPSATVPHPSHQFSPCSFFFFFFFNSPLPVFAPYLLLFPSLSCFPCLSCSRRLPLFRRWRVRSFSLSLSCLLYTSPSPRD